MARLRYLQMGDIRLVREAHEERRALMNVVAPHLVHRLPFVFPLYAHGPHRPWFVRTGVLLYSALARAKLNGRVSEKRALRLVPQLRTEGLHSCALYADAWTNDGRLTLANVRAAADRGAVVANYANVVAVHDRGAEVTVDEQTVAVRARSIVNATGPWLDQVRRLEDPSAAASIRLSKGVHLIVDGGEDWSAAVTIPHDKVRVSFVIPWEGKLLLGTTDTLHEGEPEEARVTEDDVRTVLEEASVAVDGIGPVRASFCGLARAAGGPRRDRERAPRDRLHEGQRRDAERGGRQADDLPANRSRRARTTRGARHRPQAAAPAGRDRTGRDRVARRA